LAVDERLATGAAAGTLTESEAARRDAFLERFFEANVAMLEVAATYLGDRLGLYRALHAAGPSTYRQLAQRSGIHERYAQEWLEQQAASGVVDVEDAGAQAEERRYTLPPGHAEALVDRESPYYMAPFASMTLGMVRPIRQLAEAFRSGAGVPYVEYGPDFIYGQAEANRPMFVHLLTNEWLPQVPDIHDRLLADPPAKVADVACGGGWSTIAIARAYPNVRVDGLDLDEPSIRMAEENLAGEDSEVKERVSFQVQDAANPSLSAQYDLVTVFEALHDMSRPVEALRAMRGLLKVDGSVLVADERAPERFEAPAGMLDRAFYGWSVLHCLPVGLAEQPSAGTGTVMRPDTLRRYAEEAGFSEVEILPIENDLWRFYRLTP
jgi:2-polyprenyl-3-methyl-5-hydroxy-6-metoxy-1,4-benzoquinol methylase